MNKHPADTSSRKNIDLYLFGDSYMMLIPDSSVFARVNKFQFGRRDYYNLEYTLNPKQKNVLLIELSERFVRTYLPYYIVTFDRVKPAVGPLSMTRPMQSSAAGIFDIKSLFNSNINSNIEYNLFNYAFLSGPRLGKADLNYRLFNRVSGDVILSDNGEFLFYRPTVDPRNEQSSFGKVSNELLTQIGRGLDSMYKYYRKAGFDEVVYSIIPNPVTILQGQGHNQVIPILQQYCIDYKLPYIDTYTAFQQHPNPSRLYRRDDTHWTIAGFNQWLALTNKELVRISER